MRIQLSIILLTCHPKESIITYEHWHKQSSYTLMFTVSKEKSFAAAAARRNFTACLTFRALGSLLETQQYFRSAG